MTRPKFYVSKTLLGGGDVNRRTVYRDDGGCGVQICVFNQEMSDWNEDREKQLMATVKALEALGI